MKIVKFQIQIKIIIPKYTELNLNHFSTFFLINTKANVQNLSGTKIIR